MSSSHTNLHADTPPPNSNKSSFLIQLSSFNLPKVGTLTSRPPPTTTTITSTTTTRNPSKEAIAIVGHSTTINGNGNGNGDHHAQSPSSKLNKVFSRKNFLKGERRQTLTTSESTLEDSKCNLEGGKTLKLFLQRLSSTRDLKSSLLPVKGSLLVLPNSSTSLIDPRFGSPKVIQINKKNMHGGFYSKRSPSMDPKGVLLFFASLSCIGSILLIFLTLSIYKEEQNFIISVEEFW